MDGGTLRGGAGVGGGAGGLGFHFPPIGGVEWRKPTGVFSPKVGGGWVPKTENPRLKTPDRRTYGCSFH
jgi:hypothetical protein